MHDFSEVDITELVSRELAAAPDPRARKVLLSLVRHLHDFIRDVEITTDEWDTAKSFLQVIGRSETGGEDAVNLLSGILGISALIRSIDDPAEHGDGGLGPALARVPILPLGMNLSIGQSGQLMHFYGTVASESGIPVGGAAVEVIASEPEYPLGRFSEVSRVRLHANSEGRFHFRSVLPRVFSDNDPEPAGNLVSLVGRRSFRTGSISVQISALGYHTVTYPIGDSGLLLDSLAPIGAINSLFGMDEGAEEAENDTRLRDPYANAPIIVLRANHSP